MHTFFEQALRYNIPMKSEHYVLDIVIQDNEVHGLVTLDIKTGSVQSYQSKSILVATGGYGRVFETTTNPYATTGDLIALLYEKGAALSNIELMQFHPTGLYPSGILISEAARSAGGILLNAKQERFTDEMQTRDALSLAMMQEMEKTNIPYVYLDMRHCNSKELVQIKKICAVYADADPSKELIKVAPSAHYSIGGILIDEQFRVCTSADAKIPIKGIYAVGECSMSGVHGANRLGGNSLLEGTVFGTLCAEEINRFLKEERTVEVPVAYEELQISSLEKIRRQKGTYNLYTLRKELQETMNTCAGVMRSTEKLDKAKEKIKELQKKYMQVSLDDKENIANTELIDYLELRSLLVLSRLLVLSAIERKESRGVHQRTDYSATDDALCKDSVVIRAEQGDHLVWRDIT